MTAVKSQLIKEICKKFIQDVETGSIKLNVSRLFALNDIVAAHQFMESNMAAGKIVVTT